MSERQAQPIWLTLDAAAERASVSRATVKRWIAAGRLPVYRASERMLRVKATDVDAVMQPVPTHVRT